MTTQKSIEDIYMMQLTKVHRGYSDFNFKQLHYTIKHFYDSFSSVSDFGNKYPFTDIERCIDICKFLRVIDENGIESDDTSAVKLSQKELDTYKYNGVDLVNGNVMLFMLNWIYTKRRYVLDPEIVSQLNNNKFSGEIPKMILNQLPDEAMSIWCLVEQFDKNINLHNLFITKSICGDNKPCLEIVVLISEMNEMAIERVSSIPFTISINDDSLNNLLEYAISINKRPPELIRKVVSFSINVLLYLCQPEVDYKGGVPKCYVRNRVKLGMKIEPAKKVTNVIVGESVGKQLREARIVAEREFKEGKRKSPHLRRGHFHHYWINDVENEGKSKLIVKWLNPIMVNGTI